MKMPSWFDIKKNGVPSIETFEKFFSVDEIKDS